MGLHLAKITQVQKQVIPMAVQFIILGHWTLQTQQCKKITQMQAEQARMPLAELYIQVTVLLYTVETNLAETMMNSGQMIFILLVEILMSTVMDLPMPMKFQAVLPLRMLTVILF